MVGDTRSHAVCWRFVIACGSPAVTKDARHPSQPATAFPFLPGQPDGGDTDLEQDAEIISDHPLGNVHPQAAKPAALLRIHRNLR